MRLDGAQLAYADLGDPAAEPIVLLRGYPANHRSWRFDYDTEVERVGRALDALGIDAGNLFGHDYGGFLALSSAQRHPPRAQASAADSLPCNTFCPAANDYSLGIRHAGRGTGRQSRR
ncbi:alpha/beta fold hydrolase [Allokutzneria albata]|uniref:Alpha/beta hydrolase fold n=1 Tax=Allokutzneria albata TaxID=211114 RepID=A0A1G9SI55_ALLAB|nr:alpha/beta fold hydrolase [Allokutzneria albata]SDM35082.1 alpha/beta hydrolase fold [Allokutzneria albata]